MSLVTKPDFNLIFASQAPSVDLPPQFNNYVRGMDETRKNNGKPTIKQFNYLHQNLDLKLLWILQNGAALPYDSSIEYAENSLAVKDGELQRFVDGVWSPFKKTVDASDVKDESGKTQQEVNDIVLDPSLAPLGWTQKDFNDQFVDVRKFIKKDMSNATEGFQAAIEAAYGGTLLIPTALTLQDTIHIEQGLNIQGTQRSVKSYATDTKRLNFALSSGKNGFDIAKSGEIIGFSMSNLGIAGTKNGGQAISVGSGLSNNLADFSFSEMYIYNWTWGAFLSYCWDGAFNRVRIQACTNGIDYASQVNALIHNQTAIVTIDNFALRHVNVEGVMYNACDISNLKKTDGAPITFFQSTAQFNSLYAENIDASRLMQVGSVSEAATLPSSVIITAPKKLGKDITVATRLNHVEIQGFDKDNVAVIGTDYRTEVKAVVSGNNAINKVNTIIDKLESGQFRTFAANGAATLSYATKRGYFEIKNDGASGTGIQLTNSLITDRIYTVSLAMRKKSDTSAVVFQGQGAAPLTATINEVGDDVVIQNFTFRATASALNIRFTGTLEFYGFQIKEGNLNTFDAPISIQPPRQAGIFEAPSEPIGVTNWVVGDKIVNKGSSDVLHWEATSATTLKAVSKVVGLTPTSTAAQIVAAMQAAGIAN